MLASLDHPWNATLYHCLDGTQVGETSPGAVQLHQRSVISSANSMWRPLNTPLWQGLLPSARLDAAQVVSDTPTRAAAPVGL